MGLFNNTIHIVTVFTLRANKRCVLIKTYQFCKLGLSSQVRMHKYHCYMFHRLDSLAHRQLGEIRNSVKLAGMGLPSKEWKPCVVDPQPKLNICNDCSVFWTRQTARKDLTHTHTFLKTQFLRIGWYIKKDTFTNYFGELSTPLYSKMCWYIYFLYHFILIFYLDT